MARVFAILLVLLAVPGVGVAWAGFRSPESLVRNVYAYYGDGSPDVSKGLPRDTATARQFFEPSLRGMWSASRIQPYDFFVQSATWKIGAVSVSILRRQYDKTYVAVTFDNKSRAITLNFVVVKGSDGWVISDVESPQDSLRAFLIQSRH